MNSRLRSNVQLMTAKAPSVSVTCHRSSKVLKLRRSDSSLTNDILKQGGTLPAVLPSTGDNSVVNPKQDIPKVATTCRKQLKVPLSRNGLPQTHNRTVSEKEDEDRHEMCHLGKQMEHLSSELSKVQDILQSCITDTPNGDNKVEKADHNEYFSAQDYAFFILELNRKIPMHPYDPKEFSEQSQRNYKR